MIRAVWAQANICIDRCTSSPKGQKSAQSAIAPGGQHPTPLRKLPQHRRYAQLAALQERHTAAVACESCHTPQLYAPALESVNWTAQINADGSPLTTWRGIDGEARA